MIRANYHTHTSRCGHALDNDEDYVVGAIERGITELGFADHVPLKGIHLPGNRPDHDTIEDYTSSVRALGEKYKADITLRIGYEAEYLDDYIGQYADMRDHMGIEYFICGQHCRIKDGKPIWYNAKRHDEESVKNYTDDVVAAIKSGLFSYIAHPDHFMNGYRVWDKIAERESRRLIETAEKYGMPLEINVAGIRFAAYKHRTNGNGDPIENFYPCPEFWDLASQYNVKGIIGIDAHRKLDLLDGVDEEAELFAKEHNIVLIDKLEFRN